MRLSYYQKTGLQNKVIGYYENNQIPLPLVAVRGCDKL